MKVPPSLSIVIATHDRPRMLRSLLASIRDHFRPEVVSIVVVDDSPHPSQLGKEFPDLPLRHIVLDRRVFLSKARNIGLASVETELIYFIDDDNVVTDASFDTAMDALVSAPNIAAILPAVLYLRDPDLVWVYATPLAPNRWGHTLIGRNRPRNPAIEGRLLETDALPNAFLIRRQALSEVGGFNESMAMSSSADLALRLKRKGWKVYAHTGAFVYHDVAPPGSVGYWSEHGAVDPERVYHDARDWFLLMRSLHQDERLFRLRATAHALRFMLPNTLAYFLRDGVGGWKPFKQLARGYLNGMRAAVAQEALPRPDPAKV